MASCFTTGPHPDLKEEEKTHKQELGISREGRREKEGNWCAREGGGHEVGGGGGGANSNHWFTTFFLQGRCRKAVLGVWGGVGWVTRCEQLFS